MGIGIGTPCCGCNGQWGIFYLGRAQVANALRSKKYIVPGTRNGFFFDDGNRFELKKLDNGNYLFLVSSWADYRIAGGLTRSHEITCGREFTHDFTTGPKDIEFDLFRDKIPGVVLPARVFSDHRKTVRLVWWPSGNFEPNHNHNHPTQFLPNHRLLIRYPWVVGSPSNFRRTFEHEVALTRVEETSFQTHYDATHDAGVRYDRTPTGNNFLSSYKTPGTAWQGAGTIPLHPQNIRASFSYTAATETYFGGGVQTGALAISGDAGLLHLTHGLSDSMVYDCQIDGVSIGQTVIRESGVNSPVLWGDFARDDCPENAQWNNDTPPTFNVLPPTGGPPPPSIFQTMVDHFHSVNDWSGVGFAGGTFHNFQVTGAQQINFKSMIQIFGGVNTPPKLWLKLGRVCLTGLEVRRTGGAWVGSNGFTGVSFDLNAFVGGVSETTIESRHWPWGASVPTTGPSATIRLTQTPSTPVSAVNVHRNITYPNFTNAGAGPQKWRLKRGVFASIEPIAGAIQSGDTIHRHIAAGFNSFPQGLEIDPTTGIVSGVPGDIGGGTAGVCITDTAGNVSEPSLNPISWVVLA